MIDTAIARPTQESEDKEGTFDCAKILFPLGDNGVVAKAGKGYSSLEDVALGIQ
jgi:hypothetical protein